VNKETRIGKKNAQSQKPKQQLIQQLFFFLFFHIHLKKRQVEKQINRCRRRELNKEAVVVAWRRSEGERPKIRVGLRNECGSECVQSFDGGKV